MDMMWLLSFSFLLNSYPFFLVVKSVEERSKKVNGLIIFSREKQMVSSNAFKVQYLSWGCWIEWYDMIIYLLYAQSLLEKLSEADSQGRSSLNKNVDLYALVWPYFQLKC